MRSSSCGVFHAVRRLPRGVGSGPKPPGAWGQLLSSKPGCSKPAGAPSAAVARWRQRCGVAAVPSAMATVGEYLDCGGWAVRIDRWCAGRRGRRCGGSASAASAPPAGRRGARPAERPRWIGTWTCQPPKLSPHSGQRVVPVGAKVVRHAGHCVSSASRSQTMSRTGRPCCRANRSSCRCCTSAARCRSSLATASHARGLQPPGSGPVTWSMPAPRNSCATSRTLVAEPWNAMLIPGGICTCGIVGAGGPRASGLGPDRAAPRRRGPRARRGVPRIAHAPAKAGAKDICECVKLDFVTHSQRRISVSAAARTARSSAGVMP